MDASLSGLFTAMTGMATTGHNIANANTPGYTRQSVIFAARRPEILAFGALGRGVEIQGIRRIQDEFVLKNLRVQTSRFESYAAVDNTLYEVEAILGSLDNDQLSNTLNSFFDSWAALAQPPINTSLKQNVLASAESLVSCFHGLNESMADLVANLENNIQNEIGNLNRLLTEVGRLNEQIMAAEINGNPANDLRDQRDYLITQVSEIAEVSVIEREDGTKDLIMAGRTLITRGSVTLLTGHYVETDSGYQTKLVTKDNLAEVGLSPGKLEGLMSSRDVYLHDVRAQLDQVAVNLIREVNALHLQGRTSMSSGMEFFSGDSMHTIEVNPAIVDNANLIASGRTTAAGDNEIALAIADLSTVSYDGTGNETINDRYRTLLTQLASNRSSFEFMVESQNSVVATLEAKMASISGVSLDEEGANLVRYQNSYNAAAKVITTVQEMYDALMNML